jgi:hypothetical protein
MTEHTLPHRLLQIWTEVVVAFGVAIAVVPWIRDPFFSWIASGDTDLLDGFNSDARDYITFSQCLLGALTAGLGLAAYWLARIPMVRGERWAWNAFVSSVGLWFVIDSTASVSTGYPRNAVFNLIIIAPAIPLLLATRPRS